MSESDCELCQADRFTHWYHEDDVCWVADCEVCCVPMVVWKSHALDPDPDTVEHMVAALVAAAESRFSTTYEIDTVPRSIPDHWHAHARDPDWFQLRSQRPLSRYGGVGVDRSER